MTSEISRSIHVHGVDFDVHFSEDGSVGGIYIQGVEVSDILRDSTEVAVRNVVMMHADTWFDEYRAEIAGEARR